MIPLQELRLGSYVLADGRIHQIRSLSDSKYDPIRLVDLDGARMGVNGPGKIEPVPLTDDTLRRFGIRQRAMNSFEVLDTGLDLECSYEIRSLHQLQTLHFGIAGEELVLKLTS